MLDDIALLNKRGPYAGMYSLQEAFRKGPKAEGGSSTAPKTSVSSKKEEEDDVKPQVSDQEDEDMEEIA